MQEWFLCGCRPCLHHALSFAWGERCVYAVWRESNAAKPSSRNLVQPNNFGYLIWTLSSAKPLYYVYTIDYVLVAGFHTGFFGGGGKKFVGHCRSVIHERIAHTH